jgi:hypothetical protein
MNELKTSLFGAMGATHFIILFIFAMIGVAIKLTMHGASRDVNSTSTPLEFKLKFFILDNWKRIINSLLLILVFLRFIPELAPTAVMDAISGGNDLLIAIGVGFGFDYLMQILKDKFNFGTVDREKIIQKL